MTKKKKGGDSRSGSMKVRVKTAKGRRISSTNWLKRQLNDPFVALAKKEGYRSRAAYKLIEIDDKFRIIKPGSVIIDLGSVPGSWSQVAVRRMKGRGRVIALDINEMEPIEGVQFILGDFLDDQILGSLESEIHAKVDAVLTDMAAPACGHTQTDHLRIMALLEASLDFAVKHLKTGGVFVGKVLRGGSENEMMTTLRTNFSVVKHFKPKSSRQDSAEMYVVATGFKAI